MQGNHRIWRSDSGHYLVHGCPGCDEHHLIPDYEGSRARWTFDGDFERPTLSPSVKHDWTVKGEAPHVCHYFLRAGRIEYCGDSTHHLAGKTVDLPEVPYDQQTR